ncbi:MAG: hypothetical protein ACI4R8_03005, partial [Candidatus Caccovivens sp.]
NIAGLGIVSSSAELQVTFAQDNYTIELTMQNTETLSEIVVPDVTDDVESVLEKIKSVLDLVNSGIYSFDFNFNYNGLELEGNIKYNNGILEISNVNVAGEMLNIRLQNNNIYIAYGNMKLKYPIVSNTENNESSSDFSQIISDLINDAFGVDIQFGVFEEVLYILNDYAPVDYFNKMVLDVKGSIDNLQITLAKLGSVLDVPLATISFVFENNDFTGANIALYDVATISLNVSGDNQPIDTDFDETGYTTDFVAGILDSAQVEENVYAFSSDLAIRYSTNTFYGNLVAMLVKDDVKGYIPAISIYTTSLGLSSYIYLIDETVYIDIHGLQIQADLNETTISEIMSFVEEKFGVSLGGDAQIMQATEEAFKVILPALDKIYGQWVTYVADKTYNGIQIEFKDDLQYMENGTFYDIVLQAFIENYENTIMPTKIVIGANIDDPNTTVYEDYSEYYLKDGDVVLEDSITQKLNFAVYLTNTSVGRYVTDLNEIFVGENYKQINRVKSNYGTTELSNYNSYTDLLDLVETIYDYGVSNRYQLNLQGEMSTSLSTTTLGGNVIVKVDNLQEGELNESGFELFDGKYLKVQGDLDIKANANSSSEVQHLLSVLYESNNTSALYATYTHGEYINSGNKFRAKINNTNLSEIISLLLNFANVDLGESLTNALSLQPNMTDFRYLQSLLGIGQNDVGDNISKADQVLSSVENVTKLLKNIQLTKTQMENGLNKTTLSITLNLEENISTINISIQEEQNNDVVVKVLREISIENLVVGDKTINLTVNFEDYVESNFDYDTNVSHINFSDLSTFVDVAVNTINTKGFSFKGSANVAIGSWDAITVEYDLFVSLDDVGKMYFYLELDVPSFVDVTYDCGGFGSTYTYYSAAMGFDNRISVLEFSDGILNVTQTTYGFRQSAFHSKETRVKAWSHNASEIGSDIMEIMAEALGLTDTIYNSIAGLIADMNPNPSLEKTILGFAKVGDDYNLQLDGETLTGDSNFGDFDITFGLSKEYTNLEGRTYRFIDSVSTQINIADMIKIPVNLESSEGTSYTTGDGKTIYTNDYYRKIYIDEARYKKVTFKTYCTNSEYDSLLLTPGEMVVFPTLTTKENTVGDETTYYEFDGWYYDSLYKTPVTTDIYMEESNLVFYAKWKVTKVEITGAVNVYNNGEFATTLRVKSGDIIDLSQLDFVNDESEFFYDSAYTSPVSDFVMPSNDIDIYVANKYTVTVTSAYGNAGTFTYTDYQGRTISLPEQESYYVDDGVTRTIYTFLGYSENLSTIPNGNKTITANWSVEVKHYYTVVFDVRQYRTSAMVAGSSWKTESSFVPESITLLEGETIDLNQSAYQPTCTGYLTAIKVDLKTFKATSWGLSAWSNGTSGGSGFTSYTVSASDADSSGVITLYACWEKQ